MKANFCKLLDVIIFQKNISISRHIHKLCSLITYKQKTRYTLSYRYCEIKMSYIVTILYQLMILDQITFPSSLLFAKLNHFFYNIIHVSRNMRDDVKIQVIVCFQIFKIVYLKSEPSNFLMKEDISVLIVGIDTKMSCSRKYDKQYPH